VAHSRSLMLQLASPYAGRRPYKPVELPRDQTYLPRELGTGTSRPKKNDAVLRHTILVPDARPTFTTISLKFVDVGDTLPEPASVNLWCRTTALWQIPMYR
jgi:hypothetical protein